MRLEQTCLCAGNTSQSRFKLRGGAVKHVEVCFSPREDGESSFQSLSWHCEVGASLFMYGKDWTKAF